MPSRLDRPQARDLLRILNRYSYSNARSQARPQYRFIAQRASPEVPEFRYRILILINLGCDVLDVCKVRAIHVPAWLYIVMRLS